MAENNGVVAGPDVEPAFAAELVAAAAQEMNNGTPDDDAIGSTDGEATATGAVSGVEATAAATEEGITGTANNGAATTAEDADAASAPGAATAGPENGGIAAPAGEPTDVAGGQIAFAAGADGSMQSEHTREERRQQLHGCNEFARTWTGGIAPEKAFVTSILHNPQQLEEMRLRLFSLEPGPVILNPLEREIYWPYVDNIWCGNGHAKLVVKSFTRRFSYLCRLGRKEQAPAAKVDDPSRRRNRRITMSQHCPARLTCIGYYVPARPDEPDAQLVSGSTGQNFWVRAIRYEFIHQDPGRAPHNHDIGESDRKKVCSAILRIAGEQVARGVSPAVVKANLFGWTTFDGQKPLISAGGGSISISDVFNAGRAWRKAHPDTSVPEQAPPDQEGAYIQPPPST